MVPCDRYTISFKLDCFDWIVEVEQQELLCTPLLDSCAQVPGGKESPNGRSMFPLGRSVCTSGTRPPVKLLYYVQIDVCPPHFYCLQVPRSP